MKSAQKGFTIVELIIVIVVIGVLASITVVAYRGVQTRGDFVKAQTDLKHINDALALYYSRNGHYPATGQPQFAFYEYSYFNGPNNNFLSELVTDYIDSVPTVMQKRGDVEFNYAYRSDGGNNYKLLRTGSIYLPSLERSSTQLADVNVNNVQTALRDPAQSRELRAWGYWTSGAATANW